MGTIKSSETRFRTVAKIENRMLCPACAVSVERAIFVYDYALGNKLIQFVLRNQGDRPVSGAVVQFRCFDAAGNCLYADDSSDQQITYTGQSCAPGEIFADHRAIKLSAYDAVNYEAWVTQVVYADGTAEDFSREDYIIRPSRILLSELLSPAQQKVIRRAWGKAARCVPQAIDDTFWGCSCGRVCDGTVCPSCGQHKNVLSPLFGREETLAYAKTLSRHRHSSKAIAATAVLLAILCGFGGGAWYWIQVRYPAETASMTTQLLNEKRYDDALAYTRMREDSGQEQRVLMLARRDALDRRDYAGALNYDAGLTKPNPEEIYRTAAQEMLHELNEPTADFSASEYALMTGDEALYDELVHALIDYCEQREMYSQAASYTHLLHNMGEEALKQVFDDAIAESLARESYEEALSWAEQHPSAAKKTEVMNNIFTDFLERGDYARALELTKSADSDRYIRILETVVDDEFVRTHIGAFYFRFSVVERRDYHAEPLTIYKEAISIADDGTVKGIDGATWTDAIALSSNEFHTLCLHKSGSVSAFGDTAFGRCSVSSWSGMVAVAAGERHSVVLSSSGNVYAVGDNSDGQCEVAVWNDVIDIAAGRAHTVALRADGHIYATGDNTAGQCEVEDYEDVIAVAAGDRTTVLLHGDGHISVIGDLAAETADTQTWTDVVAVSCGSSHVIGLRADGTVLVAGSATAGDVSAAADWQDVTAIAAGNDCIAGLRADGTLLVLGSAQPVQN